MKTVAMFIPCFVDQLNPEAGMDMARVLRRVGYAVDFPEAQTCCGQPGFNSGYWNEARPLAERAGLLDLTAAARGAAEVNAERRD